MKLLMPYLIGLPAVVAVALAWVAVQNGWRRTFPEVSSDPDVLAGRPGCYGCRGNRCTSSAECENRSKEETP
ncbi:MAG: hypothetical protein GY716_15075 [bacterium]|nr:hypothetical protein [bacterium]